MILMIQNLASNPKMIWSIVIELMIIIGFLYFLKNDSIEFFLAISNEFLK